MVELNLDDNVVVQTLANANDSPYVREAIVFCYLLAVVRGVKGKNFVHTICLSMLRGFGSLGLVLPLVLGKLPDTFFWKNYDQQLLMILLALFWTTFVVERVLPKDVTKYTDYLSQLCYAIWKANACGLGFVAAQEAVSNSTFAALAGSYLAVNGHRLAEDGVSTLKGASFDEDDLLAVFGGVQYLLLTKYFSLSANVARFALVLFRLSCHYVDYNSILDNISSSVRGAGAKSAGRSSSPAKRGRSRTPSRKKN